MWYTVLYIYIHTYPISSSVHYNNKNILTIITITHYYNIITHILIVKKIGSQTANMDILFFYFFFL
jgi:hypothetical protein